MPDPQPSKILEQQEQRQSQASFSRSKVVPRDTFFTALFRRRLDCRKRGSVLPAFDRANEASRPSFVLVEPTIADFQRAAAVVRQYRDSQIDFVDAVLVAIAERLNIVRILTIDARHFRMFRPKHCPGFDILP